MSVAENQRSIKCNRDYEDSDSEKATKLIQFINSFSFSNPLSCLKNKRSRCNSCHKNKQYVCSNCLTVVAPESHPPSLRLPIDVHVMYHSKEKKSKSTMRIATTISPNIYIHSWPSIANGPMDVINSTNCILLYPSDTACTIDCLTQDELVSIKAVVVIEATWRGSNTIVQDSRLNKLKRVKLINYTSLFWRYQHKGITHLATIEAVYYCIVEYIHRYNNVVASTENQRYLTKIDDLMYYYIHQFIQIQRKYIENNREFTNKHYNRYILKSIDWSIFYK